MNDQWGRPEFNHRQSSRLVDFTAGAIAGFGGKPDCTTPKAVRITGKVYGFQPAELVRLLFESADGCIPLNSRQTRVEGQIEGVAE